MLFALNIGMDTGQFVSESDDNTCRVLVVEDNPDMARLLAMALEREGHDFQTARNGTEALVVAALYRPHVAIIDIGLPGLDGFYVARELRKIASEILIIAATGRSDPDAFERSREAGFDHHFVKPINLAALADVLQQWKGLTGCSA